MSFNGSGRGTLPDASHHLIQREARIALSPFVDGGLDCGEILVLWGECLQCRSQHIVFGLVATGRHLVSDQRFHIGGMV